MDQLTKKLLNFKFSKFLNMMEKPELAMFLILQNLHLTMMKIFHMQKSATIAI